MKSPKLIGACVAAILLAAGIYFYTPIRNSVDVSNSNSKVNQRLHKRAALDDSGQRRENREWERIASSLLESSENSELQEHLVRWSKSHPQEALSYFMKFVCQPSLSEAQAKTDMDLYLMIKLLVMECPDLDKGTCEKILRQTQDTAIRSALIWGIAERLSKEGRVGDCKELFSSLSTDDRDGAANNFFVVLGNKDPKDAAAFLEGMGIKGDGVAALVQVWSKTDWKAALTWLRTYQGSALEEDALKRMAVSIASLDSAESDRFLREVGDVRAETLKVTVAQSKIRLDFKQGAIWALEHLPESSLPDVMGNGVLKYCDDEEFIMQILPHLSGKLKPNVETEFGKKVAERLGSQQALEWLANSQDFDDKNYLFSGILAAWVTRDPQAAFDYANSTKQYEVQDLVVSNMMHEIIKVGKLDEKVVNWLIQTKLGAEATSRVVSEINTVSPEMAAKIVDSSGEVDGLVVRGVATRLAEKDGEKGAIWASQLVGRHADGALADAMVTWAAKDPDKAYNFIANDLDPGRSQPLIPLILANLEGASHQTKLSYIALLTDSKARASAMQLIK